MILISWRKLFFVDFASNLAKNSSEFLTRVFLFLTAGMMAARWNLVRTECGPILQKIATPGCNTLAIMKENFGFCGIFFNTGLCSSVSKIVTQLIRGLSAFI